MKTVLTIILCTIFLAVIGQTTDNLVTEKIIYTVSLGEKSGIDGGHYNYLDSVLKANFINQICDFVYNKKLKAAYYWGDHVGARPDYYNILDTHLLESHFAWNDTIKYRPYAKKSKHDRDIERDNRVYRNLINSLSFQEQWHFDKTKNTLTKKINGIILFMDRYTHNTGMNCNFYIALNDTTPNEYIPKYLLAKNIIYDVPITKSGKYDETNWWHNYLEASKRERFLDIITDKALYDTILPLHAFNPVFPYDSMIQRGQVRNDALSELYYGRSNWYTSDPLMFGMTQEKIQACCFRTFRLDNDKKDSF